MTNLGAFVWRAKQSNSGEAHANSIKFGLSSICPCYWPPQTSWGAIANKANGNRAIVIYLYNVMEHLTNKHWQTQALKEKDVRELVAATNTLIANDDPRPATQEPNPYENNEEEDSADEEDILPLPEKTLPTQDNMDISGVEEQGDGGDEPHQGSPETSLSPKTVAPGHATVELLECQQRWIDATNAFNEAVQLTTQDSANFIMLQIEEVSALQDATTTLEVQWLKHKLLSCFGMESTSDEEMLDAIARHPEFHWIGGEIFLQRVLFNQAMPHWQDPRMPMHSRTLRQEEQDVAIFVGWLLFQAFKCNAQLERFQMRMTDDLPEEDYMRWTSRHVHHISRMHSTNCEVVKACVAAVVWHYLFIEPNVVGDLLRDDFQHSMHMEAR
ncbi:hypothetical protein SELMODRAFT_409618 [Selaginella moellendorffii]|uniref:Uncharacterized protein n=1 Tax=Selaginella moellendorffii TaxID=88036 RepID=D8RDH0_SELML|nr:hypothetical protein SELMODRAFT_409618 [Selaginella moellendorffii]